MVHRNLIDLTLLGICDVLLYPIVSYCCCLFMSFLGYNHCSLGQAFGLHANANLSAAIKEGLGATWMQWPSQWVTIAMEHGPFS